MEAQYGAWITALSAHTRGKDREEKSQLPRSDDNSSSGSLVLIFISTFQSTVSFQDLIHWPGHNPFQVFNESV